MKESREEVLEGVCKLASKNNYYPMKIKDEFLPSIFAIPNSPKQDEPPPLLSTFWIEVLIGEIPLSRRKQDFLLRHTPAFIFRYNFYTNHEIEPNVAFETILLYDTPDLTKFMNELREIII